jgi:hypothetical protein
MKKLKNILFTTALSLSMTALPHSIFAGGCDDDGCGYEDCRRAPCFSPTYALGTVVLVAVAALLITNGDGSIHHSHND